MPCSTGSTSRRSLHANLSHYVSLALYLEEPPTFGLKVKEAELPPDADAVADIVPLMKDFYQKIGLHSIWERHHARYTELTEIYHVPLAKMTFDTEIYLKMPSSGYLGRRFTVYLDAMGAPGQTNARNYGSDYYVVISPTPGTSIKLQQIRHTYLHYLLDPLALKNGGAFGRLEPLLGPVQNAPMDEAFKSSVSLLVTECLIRAIEVRMSKLPEAEQAHSIDDADKQGYVLTPYFYDALGKFDKSFGGSARRLHRSGRFDRSGKRNEAGVADQVCQCGRPRACTLEGPSRMSTFCWMLSGAWRRAIGKARRNWRRRRSINKSKTPDAPSLSWRKWRLPIAISMGHANTLNGRCRLPMRSS